MIEIIIETTNILSLGTNTREKEEATIPKIKGVEFFKLLYCSIQSTTKRAVKENSNPAVLNSIFEPTIAPNVEPTNQ